MFGIDDIVSTGLKILDKFVPDPKAKAEFEQALRADFLKVDLAQMEVNKVEAASAGWYKGGWRPAVGWICAIAMGYHFIVVPFLVFGLEIAGIKVTPPALNMAPLNTILMGMLGLGGMRSWEKLKGLTK